MLENGEEIGQTLFKFTRKAAAEKLFRLTYGEHVIVRRGLDKRP